MTHPSPPSGCVGRLRRPQARKQLFLLGARQLGERRERALDHVSGVARLTREFLVPPPERPLAFVDRTKSGFAEPARKPRAGVAPTRGGHALHHRVEKRLERWGGRLCTAGRIVDLDRGDPPLGYEHTPGLAEGSRRVGNVLEQPHHPDVVERSVFERERERIRLTQRCLDSDPLEVDTGEFELLLFDVDTEQLDTWVVLPEHRQNCADAAADLEQTRSRLEAGAVGNEAVTPVLGLLHKPLLLRRSVTVDVISHLPAKRPDQPSALS